MFKNMENEFDIYNAKAGESIKNEYNEKWIKMDSDDPSYEKVKKALSKIDEKFGIELLSVVEVDDGDYYLGFYAGGFNGGGSNNKWSLYLDEIKKILESFKHSWIIDLTNDCCDDVWYLTIGFEK